MKIIFFLLVTSMPTNFQFYETIQVIENIEIRKYDEQIPSKRTVFFVCSTP
jgi:hypothetical protein